MIRVFVDRPCLPRVRNFLGRSIGRCAALYSQDARESPHLLGGADRKRGISQLSSQLRPPTASFLFLTNAVACQVDQASRGTATSHPPDSAAEARGAASSRLPKLRSPSNGLSTALAVKTARNSHMANLSKMVRLSGLICILTNVPYAGMRAIRAALSSASRQ